MTEEIRIPFYAFPEGCHGEQESHTGIPTLKHRCESWDLFFGFQASIRVAIVVGEPSRTHEQSGAFVSRTDYAAEVFVPFGELLILLGSDHNLNSREIFYRLTLLDILPSCYRGLVTVNSISIG